MHIWRKIISGHKTVSWLLLVALLGLMTLPTHMHLHHNEQSSSISHDHAIDLHVIYEQIDQGHHDEAAVIDTITDFLIKHLNDSPLVAFILVLFVLTAIAVRLIIRHRLVNHIHFRYFYYQFAPPLRAPPLL